MRHAAHRLSPSQAEELKGLFGDRKSLQQGMTIAGLKCVFLRDDLDTEDIYTLNLKTRADAEGQRYCISIGKTKKGKKGQLPRPRRTCWCSLTQLLFCVCVAFIIAKGHTSAQGGQVPNKMYSTVKHLRDANM